MAVTIKLNQGCEDEKVYQVPFISGRALRRLDMVAVAYDKENNQERPTKEDLENCWEWFCLLFRNQFTVEELLDGYPAGDLMPDIYAAYALMVKGALKALSEFPIQPAAMKTEPETADRK